MLRSSLSQVSKEIIICPGYDVKLLKKFDILFGGVISDLEMANNHI